MDNSIRSSVVAAGMGCSLLMLVASPIAATPLPNASGRSAAGSPVPVVFEANQGQVGPQVKFLARGRHHALLLTPAEAILADRRTGQTVRVRLKGARPDVELTGLDPLPGRIHYIVGRDPAAWQTGVPTYGRVAYRQAYPGIDAVYRIAAGSRFEQEFLVGPGAEPARIRLAFGGVKSVTVDAAGDLVLTTEGGPMMLARPVAYQEVAGVRRPVDAAWRTHGSNEAGFRLGAYDRSHTLVIDPVITWATYLSGSGWNRAFAIAVDAAGSVYVTGEAEDVTATAVVIGSGPAGSHNASSDPFNAFVTKLDPTGQTLVYSLIIGSPHAQDGGRAIAVDAAGSAYVAGFTGAFFPTTPGAFQLEHGGGLDAFLLKLGPDGTLVYATYLGGALDDVALGIAVDSVGRAHVTGGTHSQNFPVVHAFQPFLGGSSPHPAGGKSGLLCPAPAGPHNAIFRVFCPRDAFVTRFGALGNVEYSTYLGGSEEDVANAIALDDDGNAYITGFTDFDFPTTPGSAQPAFGGDPAGVEQPDGDAFVARIDAGGALAWSTYLGGMGLDVAVGIAVDGEGRPHVVGSTTSTDFPATDGDQFTGVTEGFVTRLAADGSAIAWSRNTGTVIPAGVALDAGGRTHLVGSVAECNTVSCFPCVCGFFDVFVAVETRATNGERLSSISFGGTQQGTFIGGENFGQAIAARGRTLWVTGVTGNSDFPTTSGTFEPTPNASGEQAFVVRLDEAPIVPPSGDAPSSGDGAVVVDSGSSSGNCFIATAAFGSPLAREVATFRQFRDRALLTHAPGRVLVEAYYRLSPPLARAVASHPVLAAGVRVFLRPVASGARLTLERPALALALVVVFAGMVTMVGWRTMRRRKAAAIASVLIGAALVAGMLTLGSHDEAPRPPSAKKTPLTPPTPVAPRRGMRSETVSPALVQPRVSPQALRDLATHASRGAS